MAEMTLYRPGDAALASVDTEELRRMLAASIKISAKHLIHMSAIWTELEARGEDLSGLRSGITVYLPLIARGELNADLVVRYAGHTMLLRHLAALPMDQQEALLREDSVTVVTRADGQFIEEKLPLTDIESRQLRFVFGDHIFSPEEQRERMADRGPRKPPSRIIAAARAAGLRTKPKPEEERRTLAVVMTPDEFAAVKAYARKNRVSLSALARAALLTAIQK